MTRDELQLSHYFHTVFVPQMAGAYNRDFWGYHLAYLISENCATWHACNGISAVLRQYSTGDSNSQSRFRFLALKQSNAAIKHLIEMTTSKTLSSRDKAAILAVNLLLGIMAWLQKDTTEACNLISRGLILIQEWNMWNHAQLEELDRAAAVSRVRSLLWTYVENDSFTRHMSKASPSVISQRELSPVWSIGGPFVSYRHSEQQLDLIYNGLMKLIRQRPVTVAARSSSVSQPAPDIRYPFQTAARKWREKFYKFQALHDSYSKERVAMTFSEPKYLLVEILLCVDLSGSELSWDAFTLQFHNIIKVVKILVKQLDVHLQKMSKSPATTEDLHRIDGLSMMLCEPLLQVVWRCRDLALRRKALALLRSQAEQWPGDMRTLLADIAEEIIAMEESGWPQIEKSGCGCIAGTYICNRDRVIDYHQEWQPNERANLFFRTQGDAPDSYVQQKVTLSY